MVEKDIQTEDRIFNAATDVFLDKGMDGARMQDIADRAGINKSLLNYYYRSKDRLFNAVFEMIAGRMLDKFAPIFDKNLSAEGKLEFFFNEHISFLQKNPRLPLFLLNEINRNPERLRTFINKIEVERVLTIFNPGNHEGEQNVAIEREKILQVLTTIVAISIFPFAAKGILEMLLGKFGISFDDYLEHRKKFAFEFVSGALKNMELK